MTDKHFSVAVCCCVCCTKQLCMDSTNVINENKWDAVHTWIALYAIISFCSSSPHLWLSSYFHMNAWVLQRRRGRKNRGRKNRPRIYSCNWTWHVSRHDANEQFWRKKRWKTKFIGDMLCLGKEGVGCYICHRVHFQLLMNIITSPQLNGGQYGVQQQHQFPLFDHCCFRLFRMHPVACCRCWCCCYGFRLTNSFRVGPSLYRCYTLHTMKIVWAHGIRFFETVIYPRPSCYVSMA